MRREDNFIIIMSIISILTTVILLLPIFSLLLSSDPKELLDVLFDQEVISAILLSIITATYTTILGILLGLPLAYILARKSFPYKETIDSLIDLPILLPHTVAGIALLTVFGPRAPFGSLLKNFGLLFTNTIFGIVIAQFFVSVPLFIKTVKEVLIKVNENYLKVARTLGAKPHRVFLDVELPLIKRGILTGSILCWARAISEFGAVIILAYYPYTAPVLIYVRFETRGLGSALAISSLLLLVTLSIFIILKYLQKKGGR